MDSATGPLDPATGGYLSSELNGFELLSDLSRDRKGITLGLSDEEPAIEAREQDIRECYAEETRWPGTLKEMRKHLEKTPGVYIFRHWHRHTSQYEMPVEYKCQQPKRVQQLAPVKPPLARQYKPIPIEAGKSPTHQPNDIAGAKLPEQQRSSGPPVRKLKCKEYVAGNNGWCMCKRCIDHARAVQEWYRANPSTAA